MENLLFFYLSFKYLILVFVKVSLLLHIFILQLVLKLHIICFYCFLHFINVYYDGECARRN